MKRPLAFEVTRHIRASNDAVWHLLADFGNEHRWTSAVSHCTRDTRDVHVGTARSCRLPRPLMGRTHAREALTEFEPGRALSYALEGPAGPFAVASSRWSTRPRSSDATSVTVEGTFEPKHAAVRLFVWPIAKPILLRITRRVLRDLEAFLLTSGPGAAGHLGSPARPAV